MESNNYGVLNEQGYPVGEFGFKPLSESEKAKLEKDEKKDKKKNEE